MAFFRLFSDSAKELKSLRCLTVTALLIALDIVLKLTLTISVAPNLKISFAFIALASVGMLFGPTVAAFAGAITDIIGYLVKPEGGFNPLFTIVEVSGAVIYGIFLYKMSPFRINFSDLKENLKNDLASIIRIVLCKLTVIVVCNLLLTPAALILSGYLAPDAFWGSFITRVMKNSLQFPVDCVLMMLFLFPIAFAYRTVFKERKAVK